MKKGRLASDDTRAAPKFREDVPIRYWPNPKGSECANLLARVENVASRAKTQHNTIMHVHVAIVWGRKYQWLGLFRQSYSQHQDR